MKKRAQIKVTVRKIKKKIPPRFKILIDYNNQTHFAEMKIKPDVPTDKVQMVLRSILNLLDKSYPEEQQKAPSYIS